MMFKELLDGLTELLTISPQLDDQLTDIVITGLALDSRKVVSGNIFIALAGAKQHGLIHLGQAIEKGACAVLFDPDQGGRQLQDALKINIPIPMIAIDNLARILGEIAARFYGNPSRLLDVIGITGTNGKTSCSQFLSQLLDNCGVIGTLGWGQWGKLNKTLNTTPDALAVQVILADLCKDNKSSVAMEVSSHGLEQGRVNGVYFKGAVFTNISRDHLDYHGTMEAYLQAKLELLKKPGLAFAVVNLDDPYSDQILAAVPESVVIWGISAKGKALASGESVVAKNIEHKIDGIAFDLCWRVDVRRVTVPLYGDFNIENVLCVVAVMLAMGVSLADVANKLAAIKPVIGRMERFGDDMQPRVFVDYAHTPDALDKALASLKQHSRQDLWVVFGCGGNRDAGKRAEMGRIAEQWADHVIITDDNPRFENASDIVKDILSGCRSDKVEVIQNRARAIQNVIARAAGNDYLLIAGKGHENYQEIDGEKQPFSDREIVVEALKMRAM
ncbi:MAG: UDP-N-acetylmuramoyl-L-alanyl-D-glutamate--2,6-diaminopimelate ligase [Methylococcaceae bacterium]